MIKKLISYAAAFAACLIFAAIPSCAFSAGINDMAGLYSPEDLDMLEARQSEVADATGWNIAVVTTDIGMGLDGVAACEYAEQYCYDVFGDDPDSVVYLIDLDYRWISIGGDMYNYFDSKRFNKMMDECEECYMDYDDIGNLKTFYYYLEYYKNQSTVEYDPTIGPLGNDFDDSITYYDQNPYNEDYSILIGSLGIGLIISVICIAVVISRYKFHYAPSANAYLNRNTVDMYRSCDRFVREYTTRTRIQSSSSGGGGSSGGFSSRSGGRSRGGGGRGGRR